MSTYAMWCRTFGGALLCAAAASASGCDVSAYPASYGGYDDYGDYRGGYPPADYLATTDPVYFDGNAAYWYNNHWFYRHGGRWGAYGREPRGLAQYRAHYGAPGRHNYGRGSMIRGGGGGMRGGGSRGGGGGHGRR